MRILIFADNKEISEQLESIILEKYPVYYIEVIDDLRSLNFMQNKGFDIVFVDDNFGDNTISSTAFIQKSFPESVTVFISDSMGNVSELFLNTTVFGIIPKPLNPSRITNILSILKTAAIRYLKDSLFLKEEEKEVFCFQILSILKVTGKNCS